MAKRLHVKLRREAKEVKMFRFLRKLIGSGVAASSSLLMIMYVVTVLYSRYGAFTVSVMKFDKVKYSIVLSEEPEFIESSAVLNCNASEEITNISGDSIPRDVNLVNGVHNGENYVAYTFYCMNNGQMTCDYTYEVYITNITKDLDKAVRVMVFVNDESTTYARVETDGTQAEGTVAFQTGNTIVKKVVEGFAPGDKTKFTVVIYLEGDDPDCVDDKLGGEFKIDMSINVIGIDEDDASEESEEGSEVTTEPVEEATEAATETAGEAVASIYKDPALPARRYVI